MGFFFFFGSDLNLGGRRRKKVILIVSNRAPVDGGDPQHRSRPPRKATVSIRAPVDNRGRGETPPQMRSIERNLRSHPRPVMGGGLPASGADSPHNLVSIRAPVDGGDHRIRHS